MTERVFTYAAPALKFGARRVGEVGHDLASYGARRVMLVTDPGVEATGHPARIADQVWQRGLEVVVFDRARVEPTDESIAEAVDFARATPVRSTPCSRWVAAPRSIPPRRSTCC